MSEDSCQCSDWYTYAVCGICGQYVAPEASLGEVGRPVILEPEEATAVWDYLVALEKVAFGPQVRARPLCMARRAMREFADRHRAQAGFTSGMATLREAAETSTS